METWIYVAGWTLVHFVWQGAVIGAGAALGLYLLRGATSNVLIRPHPPPDMLCV